MSSIRCTHCGQKIKAQNFNAHKRTHTEEQVVYMAIEQEIKILLRFYNKSEKDQESYKKKITNYKKYYTNVC